MGYRQTRREFLANTTAALTAAVARGGGAVGAENRPNILWLISEDTGPEFGCYGYSLVHTPNVDRLAAEGARFNAVFTTAPVCSPSRSSFMTGMFATTIGAHNHRSHRRDGYTLPGGVYVFTKYLRDAGYFIALPGKRKTDWNFKYKVRPYDSFQWEDLKTHQPFFAQYQFSETHRRFKHCPKHPVDPNNVALPPYYPDHPVARQDWALYLETINVLDEHIGEVLKKLERDGLADNTIVFYFADHGRAHVRGKQWLYDGGIHIPLVVRWPGHLAPGAVVDELVSALDFAPTCLDLAGADVPKHMQGRIFLGPYKQPEPRYIFATRDRCDETVDRIRCVRSRRYKYIRNFMPERPYTQPNRYKERAYPMVALMKQLHAEGKLTPAQELFMAPRRPPEELYDVQADPWEIHNLAANPNCQNVLEEMRAALDHWISETDDKGRFPETEEELKRARDRAQPRNKRKGSKGKPGRRLPKKGMLPRQGWRIAYVDSEERQAQQMEAKHVLDGDPMTCWHTRWKGKRPDFPHEIQIDMGRLYTIRAIQYLPRQDRGRNGKLRRFEVYASTDAKTWGKPVARGVFKNSLDEQQADFAPVRGRYVRLVVLSGYSPQIAAIAELNLLAE